MAYSVVSDVRSIVDTDIEDAEITNIITWVDEVIDLKINSGSLSAVFLENLSATYAAYRCMLKDPNARRLGEYSENREETLKRLKEEIDELFEIGDIAASGVNVIVTYEDLA